jgi:uncharacterized integral membrane protein
MSEIPDDLGDQFTEPPASPHSGHNDTDHAPAKDRRRGRSHRDEHGYRHTRTSAAWVAVAVAILFGVALIDFIAQNTRHVKIEFFAVSGRIPVAVALLAAALSGAIVVVAIGIGRVAQLRLNMRRQRRHAKDVISDEVGDESRSVAEEGDEDQRS